MTRINREMGFGIEGLQELIEDYLIYSCCQNEQRRSGDGGRCWQKQKSLLQRVDADIGNLVDNFEFIVNVARVNDPPVRNSQESFMMEMRAARMVHAADSLLKLVSELKQTVFSGFASLNDHVDQRTEEFNKLTENTNSILSRIGEESDASLKELESHYYSSTLGTSVPPEL